MDQVLRKTTMNLGVVKKIHPPKQKIIGYALPFYDC